MNDNKELLMTEASLSDSVIFNSFNGNAEVNKILITAMKDSINIDANYIEEQILQIQRTRISPLADEVLHAYNDGDIMILYSKNTKTPKFIPFIVTKIKGQMKAIIFANNFGTISKSEKDSSQKFYNISMKDLYVLMEGAYVSLQYAMYPNKMQKSLTLMKLCSNIYTNFFIRIFNKECQLSMDLNGLQTVTFILSKFFIENVWGYKNGDISFNYAKGNIIGAANTAQLLIINDMYDKKNITDFKMLMEFIREACPKISISFRYLVQCYINSYKDVALLGMDCLPYFLFTIQATMLGSFIINEKLTSDITKNTKNMNQFYPELVKAVN